jgi:hypothetical protein
MLTVIEATKTDPSFGLLKLPLSACVPLPGARPAI